MVHPEDPGGSGSGFSRASTQTGPGFVHELAGLLGERADEAATLLDYLAADDDGFDVGGAGAHDEGGDRVAEAVEVGCAHVDDRHVGVFADGKAADLRVEMP